MELYQSTGKVDEAIKTYKEFLVRFPNSYDAPKVASLVHGLQKEVSSESPDNQTRWAISVCNGFS